MVFLFFSFMAELFCFMAELCFCFFFFFCFGLLWDFFIGFSDLTEQVSHNIINKKN